MGPPPAASWSPRHPPALPPTVPPPVLHACLESLGSASAAPASPCSHTSNSIAVTTHMCCTLPACLCSNSTCTQAHLQPSCLPPGSSRPRCRPHAVHPLSPLLSPMLTHPQQDSKLHPNKTAHCKHNTQPHAPHSTPTRQRTANANTNAPYRLLPFAQLEHGERLVGSSKAVVPGQGNRLVKALHRVTPALQAEVGVACVWGGGGACRQTGYKSR